MTIEGVDALAHPTPTALKAAGKAFVAQYLKAITAPQIAAYRAAGIAVVLISEHTGRDTLNGYAAGVARGRADAAALTALGAPGGTACYVAEADFDPNPAQLATIGQYALGHSAGIGTKYRSGFYGGLEAVTAAHAAGYRGLLWQTYAWSGGKWAPGCTLQQYLNGQSVGGVGVDFTRASVPDYGQWAPVAAPKPAPGLPAPVAYPGKPVGWSTSDTRVLVFLQRCLVGAGYKVPISGKFDAATRAAVARYQVGHAWAFLRDQPCGPGAVKARTWASLSTYYGKG